MKPRITLITLAIAGLRFEAPREVRR